MTNSTESLQVAKLQAGRAMSGSSGTFSKVLTYPIYLGYWAVGLGAASTVALSYFNSEHADGFRNIFGFVLADPKALWLYENRYGIVFAFLLLVAIKYFLDLKKEQYKWRHILTEIVESNRRFDVLEEYLDGRKLTPALAEHISSELTGIANCICNLLNQYTDKECHVAIKLLDRNGGIATIARSQAGSTHRRDVDENLNGFWYAKNSAFAYVIDRKKAHYVSNWLLFRWICQRYHNSHKGWFRYYRSTAVVPITTAGRAGEIGIENTYGFVCADNRRGHFDHHVTPLLLAGAAARCVTVLLKLSQVQQ
ncbi:hypothetical protein HAP48_0044820 [Bradyrhizobium septentrionale]|uniref:Uncharacterized protein n=1 Tax=Bradyrhizobium septentrionale TaxID=1404411 RepID=A0A974A1Z2_9BRAD|nr:hypothetical protein [Bradyrhizobium septentrionale]UGY15564.1 hypothetical protein HAP48_0044820 [Bradyrhizobium septentrionale]UGY24146.1 hypothetical protein HU675_0040490 [Bradyrhizobium septentrionale]